MINGGCSIDGYNHNYYYPHLLWIFLVYLFLSLILTFAKLSCCICFLGKLYWLFFFISHTHAQC